jgi:hypothetical protein
MDSHPDRVTAAPVEAVPITAIRVGRRRRQALGPLDALCRSIIARGLIHPILIRGDGELVAGARRLEACRRLDWRTIPARRVDGLTDDQVRALELHENVERLPLLDAEASAERLAALRAEATTTPAGAEGPAGPAPADGGLDGAAPRISGQGLSRKSRGRPPGRAPGSQRALAAATGVAKGTVQHLERQVALADRFPFLRRPGWSQTATLAAGAKLDGLPAEEHGDLGRLLDQPGVPPKDALGILGALARRSVADRRGIYAMARSADPHVRGNALAKAARLPPNPDPGYLWLLEATRTLRQAATQCRIPALAAAIGTLADQAHHLVTDWEREVTHADAP